MANSWFDGWPIPRCRICIRALHSRPAKTLWASEDTVRLPYHYGRRKKIVGIPSRPLIWAFRLAPFLHRMTNIDSHAESYVLFLVGTRWI